MRSLKLFSILSLVFFAGVQARAVTTVNFFIAGQVMVNITSQGLDGSSDQDPVELYKLMRVPPQNSFMGPGKAIVTEDRDLNFTCGTPPGRGATCSIMFNHSPRVSIDPLGKVVQFHVVGREALILSKLFVLNEGKLEFLSSDQLFKMHITAEEVIIEAKGN